MSPKTSDKKVQGPAAAIPDKPADSPDQSSTDRSSTKALFLIIAGIVLLFVIFFASRTYFLSKAPKTVDEQFQDTLTGKETETSYLYNGYSFVFYDGLWYMQIKRADSKQPYRVALHFSPRQLENISVYGNVSAFTNMVNRNYGFAYLTFDPEGNNRSYVALSMAELTASMGQVLNLNYVVSCTRDSVETCHNLTIVNCSTASQATIYLNDAPEPMLYADGLCLTVQGPQMDVVRATNKLLYIWYGVMDGDGSKNVYPGKAAPAGNATLSP